MISILDQFGKDAVVGALRSHLEDVEVEVRRRIRELPDGTTRVNAFMDSTLRENCIQKIQLAITVKGDQMVCDFRGSSPQFMNRAVTPTSPRSRRRSAPGCCRMSGPTCPHHGGTCRRSRSCPIATRSSTPMATCPRR